MLIGVVAETDPLETRVAASAETVKRFVGLGAEFVVQHGAGLSAGVTDADYEGAGARMAGAAEVLSSATMMAQASATEEAVSMALAMPSLGVGCHIVMVDGTPVSDKSNIPSLIDRNTSLLHPTPGSFLKRLYTARIRSAEVEADLESLKRSKREASNS